MSTTPAAVSAVRAARVADAARGTRLDRWLAVTYPDLSRARIQALIAAGHVAVDGTTLRTASYRVKPGERITLAVPPIADAAPAAQAIPLAIVYEDADVIVVDKPAGLVVHPAAGNPDRTLINALLYHCGASLTGVGGVKRPGIVHRLDKDTSGLIVAAKNERAHQALIAQFAARTIDRLYLAVVWGVPTPSEGRIEGNIGRSPRHRKKMALLARGGRAAATRYKVVRILDLGVASVIECRLETGRTHQIRVHVSARGHPVVGDPTYGRAPRRLTAKRRTELAFDRQALHAANLGFDHPRSGQRLWFKSELPQDMRELINRLDQS
ncbi:MAG: RluA family pseudouridine synthase [Alphaproteobacteria bacterium]|nr:RluA family pseudouridine synthase [Alphaproteobacteria bacterium]